jgi:hypothetical protein
MMLNGNGIVDFSRARCSYLALIILPIVQIMFWILQHIIVKKIRKMSQIIEKSNTNSKSRARNSRGRGIKGTVLLPHLQSKL